MIVKNQKRKIKTFGEDQIFLAITFSFYPRGSPVGKFH